MGGASSRIKGQSETPLFFWCLLGSFVWKKKPFLFFTSLEEDHTELQPGYAARQMETEDDDSNIQALKNRMEAIHETLYWLKLEALQDTDYFKYEKRSSITRILRWATSGLVSRCEQRLLQP